MRRRLNAVGCGTAIGLSFALVNTFTTVGTFLVPIVQNKYGIGITVLSGAILTLLGALICVRFAPETRELTLVEAAKLNPDAPTVGQTTTKVEYSAQ